MYLKTKYHFTSTYDFRNDSLQFCDAFAHSLEWLYDEDNFEDEHYWLYCMNGVMPIFVLMSVLKDIIVFAFDDYAEPNIKDYINRMESDNDKHSWNENEPFIKYEGEYLIVGQVHSFTTEVILWAAYLYFTFRTEINKDYKKAERGRKVLYKLYRQKAGVKEEYLKETFLMTHFNQSMITLVKNVPTSSSEPKNEERQKPQMEKSVIDKISANNIRYYYEGWRNGKHGSICQQNGIYRFVEMVRGKSGMLDDVNRNEEDNPIVAKGIVAYWLQFNSRMDTVIKRLTKYNCEIPKDIREQFDNYTQIRFEQFRREHRDDPNTWDWDWEKEFYANVIIPHEIGFNKLSEAIFDYISDSDIVLVRGVMKSYIKYLKKIRTEKGYQVNPELLVLRAIDSGDETKQEDLEEFEVNTILDKLEEKGYIQVAWIEGHKPEGVRLLDKGRCYLKQLEEGSVVAETKPVVTTQQPPKENSGDNLPQTPNSSVREITWEERKQCFKTAVLAVMEKKRTDGDYLFENNSQWMAVYRFAVDLEIMYKADDLKKPKDTSAPQYAAFANFAKELQLDENPPTRLPFTKNAIDSINSKPNYARFNTTHPWSHEGITDPRSLELFVELEDVYLALKEEYENLVSQAERAIG